MRYWSTSKSNVHSALPFECSNKKSLWHCILYGMATLWDGWDQTNATKEIFLLPRLTIFIYQFHVKGLLESIYTHQLWKKLLHEVMLILYFQIKFRFIQETIVNLRQIYKSFDIKAFCSVNILLFIMFAIFFSFAYAKIPR